MTPDEVPADLIEKACRARWDALDSVFTGYNGDVARTWDAVAALFPAEADRRRSNERHTLAAVLPSARKVLVAELDVYKIAHDLHSLHAEPDGAGSCADCDFRAGFLIGRLAREYA